jgi:hypothetical protein
MLRGIAVLVALLSSIFLIHPADAFDVTFNDLNEKLLLDSSQAPLLGGDCPDCPFSITNSTGVTWTDFHLELRLTSGPPGRFGFINVAEGGFDGDVYEGPGSDSLSDLGDALDTVLDIIGLNIPDGGIYGFNVDMATLELQGTYGLFGRPTTDGNGPPQVPGPATLVLVSMGLLGLGGYRLVRQ